MGVIKIETFDVNVTAASSQTHTLTNTIDLSKAFVRRTTSIDKQSGLTTDTGNLNPNDACSAAYLSSTTQISFRQDNTNSQKVIGEVWRYTGAASGPDEFIVRGRHTITLGSGTATGSASVSGISDVDKCIPFWTGATQTADTVNDYDASTVSVYIDASDNIQVERGATTGTLVVYVTVVEFTGANWTVGHGRSASHDSLAETVTLNTSSTGTGGSTFDVGSWSNAMIIEASLEGDTSETGLSDNLGVWAPGSTSQASFTHLQDSASRNDGVSYCHVLVHPGLIINRGSNINISEPNGDYATNATWPTGSSTSESLDELSLEWFSDTSGTGTAHARGRLSARITSATGTITYWVHRSGNNVRADWGVAEVGAIDGTIKLILDNVDGDNTLTNTQTNVVITASGGGLEASQGSGTVKLTQNADGTGTSITQSIDSWSDTSIQFDVTAGALADTYCYVRVETDGGEIGTQSIQLGLPPETYKEAVEAMTLGPDHYWTFQNTFDDEIGTAGANSVTGGTITFSTSKLLCRGDTHSVELDTTTEYFGPANQTDMNSSAISRRYVGGWFMLNNISQTLSVIWEEGAQVNNIALLNGFGNNAVFQIANASDDYVQTYFDKPIVANRPTHVLLEFNASGFNSGVCSLYVDGIKQARTNGNPWETAQLDSHTGSITFGHSSGESLKVGDDRGVDATTIAFVTPTNCNYAHWYSWSDTTLNAASDIRVTLFEKGVSADVTISSDTESNMQTALDAYADTERPNWPCAIKIEACDEGDFELILDNITFNERGSIDIQYVGSDDLTLILENGSSVNPDKISTPYGGTVTLISPVITTITGIPEGAEWRLYEKSSTPGTIGTVQLAGEESKSDANDITYSDQWSSDTDVVLQVMAEGYEEYKVEFTLSNIGQTIIVNLIQDINGVVVIEPEPIVNQLNNVTGATNPDDESNVVGDWYNQYQATMSVDSSEVHEGSYSVKAISNDISGSNRIGWDFDVVEGMWYTISIWAKGSDTNQLIRVLGTDNPIEDIQQWITDEWDEYVYKYQADADGTASIRAYSARASGGDAGQTIWIDNLSILESEDVVFDPSYQDVLDKADALSYTKPSYAQQLIQNQVVFDLKDDQQWWNKDLLYIPANDGSKEFSCLNWRDPDNYELSIEGTVSWTSNVGFKGDGSTGYLETGWIARDDAINFKYNDARINMWVAAMHPDLGTDSNFYLYGATQWGADSNQFVFHQDTSNDRLYFDLNSGGATYAGSNNGSDNYLGLIAATMDENDTNEMQLLKNTSTHINSVETPQTFDHGNSIAIGCNHYDGTYVNHSEVEWGWFSAGAAASGKETYFTSLLTNYMSDIDE